MRNQIRQNLATGEWVIYAPARGKRPRDFRRPAREQRELPERDPGCPFCPGNERELDEIVLEMPGREGLPWGTRVIPNKYPALVPEGGIERHREGIYVAMPGYGRHEVIIESPLHNRQPVHMDPEEMQCVVETYHRRYSALLEQHHNLLVILFRNHGERAGTSLIHPHSQAIVTGIVPSPIRRREEAARHYFDRWGRCVYCDILNFEQKDRTRVLEENASFLAFIPFAADVPFEVWIVPKEHQADFGQITEAQRADLAALLHAVLSGLCTRLNDPDYNYVIVSSARYRAGEPQLHWYVRVRPRLTTFAGFEIGSGMSINPSFPEDDARFWREHSGEGTEPC